MSKDPFLPCDVCEANCYLVQSILYKDKRTCEDCVEKLADKIVDRLNV
jgi:hypothetical protein